MANSDPLFNVILLTIIPPSIPVHTEEMIELSTVERYYRQTNLIETVCHLTEVGVKHINYECTKSTEKPKQLAPKVLGHNTG